MCDRSRATLNAVLEVFICLLAILSLSSCVSQQQEEFDASGLHPLTYVYDLTEGLQAVNNHARDWAYGTYIVSLVEIVEPREGSQTYEFGPWTAERDYEAEDAPSDGSLSEWRDHYYITHDWSSYGQAILSMSVGDSVLINDQSFVVEGVFNYPKSGYYEDIAWYAGFDKPILQTCVPGRDLNRLVYGSWSDNNAQAA